MAFDQLQPADGVSSIAFDQLQLADGVSSMAFDQLQLADGVSSMALLKFWLKTRKSILNKVAKFQIPTPNRLGARIEKLPGGGKICPPPPARNRVKARRIVFDVSQSNHRSRYL